LDASLARHLLTAIGGAAECFGSDDIWVPRVGREDFKPGALAPAFRLLDADELHL